MSQRAAVGHLRAADPVLAGMLEDLGDDPPAWTPTGDPYGAIIRAIVSQQLSVTAARAIHGRLLTRFGGREPTPAEVLADDPDALKSVGLSRAKVVSLRSLAGCIEDGTLELDRLAELDDDALIDELTMVKGIGEWTAQVLLVTELARPDVLVTGDLVIRRAVERGWDLPALPTREELLALGAPWRPYRSTACALLWAWMRVAPTA
jgi:DNA-3-methyladenine glycosylase II